MCAAGVSCSEMIGRISELALCASLAGLTLVQFNDMSRYPQTTPGLGEGVMWVLRVRGVWLVAIGAWMLRSAKPSPTLQLSPQARAELAGRLARACGPPAAQQIGCCTIDNLIQLASTLSLAQRMAASETPCMHRWGYCCCDGTWNMSLVSASNATSSTAASAWCDRDCICTCVQATAGAGGAGARVSAAGGGGAAVAPLRCSPEAGGPAGSVDLRRDGWVGRVPVPDL